MHRRPVAGATLRHQRPAVAHIGRHRRHLPSQQPPSSHARRIAVVRQRPAGQQRSQRHHRDLAAVRCPHAQDDRARYTSAWHSVTRRSTAVHPHAGTVADAAQQEAEAQDEDTQWRESAVRRELPAAPSQSGGGELDGAARARLRLRADAPRAPDWRVDR